jgi:shikimate kinase
VNLYLVGMMGAGKSSVGRPLAEALGYRFIDSDTVVEQAAGRPIDEIFEREGETGFRDLETAVLQRIAGWHSLVVATGGGVVTRPVNWGHMHQGLVVWLDAPESVLLRRLQADPTPRPLLAGADGAGRLRQLLAERRPLYGQADLTVLQGEEPPQQVVDRVLLDLPTILRPPAGSSSPAESTGGLEPHGEPLDRTAR